MKRTWPLVFVVIALALLSVSAPAAAQPSSPAGAQSASPDQPDQFVPVKSLPAQEQLPAPALVMTAYGFVWAVLLVYLWTIWRRLMKVEREMRDLSSRIGEKR